MSSNFENWLPRVLIDDQGTLRAMEFEENETRMMRLLRRQYPAHVKGASRAVGAANGANPISIVVPCHRVIGADSSLTGFGSGLPRKQWLLDHECRAASATVVACGE